MMPVEFVSGNRFKIVWQPPIAEITLLRITTNSINAKSVNVFLKKSGCEIIADDFTSTTAPLVS